MKTIELPFNQTLELHITEKQESEYLVEIKIKRIKKFASEGIEALKSKELNAFAKLSKMTNEQFANDRCKLIEKDLKFLAQVGIDWSIK